MEEKSSTEVRHMQHQLAEAVRDTPPLAVVVVVVVEQVVVAVKAITPVAITQRKAKSLEEPQAEEPHVPMVSPTC